MQLLVQDIRKLKKVVCVPFLSVLSPEPAFQSSNKHGVLSKYCSTVEEADWVAENWGGSNAGVGSFFGGGLFQVRPSRTWSICMYSYYLCG